jgi:hypothetical protein
MDDIFITILNIIFCLFSFIIGYNFSILHHKNQIKIIFPNLNNLLKNKYKDDNGIYYKYKKKYYHKFV